MQLFDPVYQVRILMTKIPQALFIRRYGPQHSNGLRLDKFRHVTKNSNIACSCLQYCVGALCKLLTKLTMTHNFVATKCCRLLLASWYVVNCYRYVRTPTFYDAVL